MKLLKPVAVFAGCMVLLLAISTSNAGKVITPIYQLLLGGNRAATLSDVQQQFIRLAGYPRVVTRTFSSENGRDRIDEVWSYPALGVMEIFINGYLIEEKQLTVSGPADAAIVYRPQDFYRALTRQQVLAKYGTPDETRNETVWNGTLDIYLYKNLYLAFNNDTLVSVFYATGYLPVNNDNPPDENY